MANIAAKTNNNSIKTSSITEIIFILDRSGSMSGLEDDTIGGYNSFLDKQKQENSNAVISTVLFNTNISILHNRLDINNIAHLTSHDYQAGGCTALLDAIGGSIKHIHKLHKNMPEYEIPNKTICVIITDGYENSSKNYTYEKIKKMIDKRQTKDNWEFVFLGANIDAVREAAKLGINKNHAIDYKCDSQGTRLNFQMMNEAVCCFMEYPDEDFEDIIQEKRAMIDEYIKKTEE